MYSVGREVVRGWAWMAAMRWSMRLIGLASTVVVARLLTPTDFGIMAIALVVVGFLETIGNAGVDLALIREETVTREHYDTAWTIQVLQACFIAALLLVVAPLATLYFNEPRAQAVMWVMSARTILEGFSNIGVVAFRKELDFAREFRFGVYRRLINLAVVITAAASLRNYWALVIGLFTGTLIQVVLSYTMHPYRPRLSLTKARDMWSFSQWLLVSRVGGFLNERSDAVVVGGLVGTTPMGTYHVATELSTMVTTEVVMPLRRALFPVLANVIDRPQEFGAAAARTFALMAILCGAAGFGFAAVAPEFVLVVLGSQWVDSIPLMQWLAVFGAVRSLVLVLETLLWVKGKTRVSALQTWLELTILLPVLVVTARHHGLHGVAVGRTAVALLTLPVIMFLVARWCPINARALTAVLWRPSVAGIVMLAALHFLPGTGAMHPLLVLVGKVLFGAVIYLGTIMVLWYGAGRPDGIERTALNHLGSTILSPRARVSAR